ncbi:MAG: acyltransferase [Burkholderiales bacterium]|nr:acyltransferase [Burkholderiales bacterium]
MINQRLDYIDELRGIAALAVVFQHLWLPLLSMSNQYVDPGLFGVYLFFWVSGYIIVFSVWRNCTPREFVIARFFRLYPIYWVSIGIYVLINYNLFDFKVLLLNLTMFQRFIGIPDLLGVYWTLQVELMFYGFVLFCLFIHKIKNAKFYLYGYIVSTLLSLICASGRFLLNIKFPVAPFIGLSLIFTSAIFFQYRHNNYLNSRLMKLFLVCALCVFCGVSLLSYSKDWGYHETPARFILMFSAAGVVFLLANTYSKFLKIRVFAFLGRISYPLYLFHMPLYLLLLPKLRSYHCNDYVATTIIMFFTICMAWLAHLIIEMPSIKFGKYLRQRS